MELKYLSWSTLKSNYQKPLLVFLIFVVFILMRTWFLPQTIPFGWDQERDAQTVEKIISHFDISLIGPRVVGDNGFYLGPYFFYLLVPFYILTGLHPNAIMYFTLFFSSIFFILTLVLLNKTYNFKISLIFLLLWSVLPLTVDIDRIAWNPFLIPISFSFLIFLLNKFQPQPRYLLFLGFVLGLIFHLHFQGLFYTALTFFYLIKTKLKSLTTFIWIILGFGLTFIPLIVFDIRHQWLNFHLFTNFFISPTHPIHSLGSFLPVWTNFIGQLSGINNLSFAILIWLLLVIFGYLNRHRPYIFAFNAILLISPIVFALYGQRPSEYYFSYLLPIIIIYVSIFMARIKIPSLIFTIIFLCIFITSFNSIHKNPTSLFYKDQIVNNAKKILNDTSVYITYQTPLGGNNGFDYLINYYKINRSQDPNRPGVQFIIPKRDSLPSSGDISLFIPEQI